MAYRKDLTDRPFGWLTVLQQTSTRGARGDVIWLVRCRCGKEFHLKTSELLRRPKRSAQAPRSCGCAPTSRIYTSKYGAAGEFSGARFGLLITQAKHRGIAFTVTLEYLWERFVAQNRRCAFTGLPLAISQRTRAEGEDVASLDRIDSNRGYEPGNVQWVHPTVNFMKHAMPQALFIAWCQLIADHSRRAR